MTKFLSTSAAILYSGDPADATDEGLVERARTDPAAFATLYDQHVKSVYRYLASKVYSPADAEDLTSQVFLAALESLHNYPPGAGFRAWLFGIARRKTADFYRKRGRQVPLAEAAQVFAPGDSLLAQATRGQSLQELLQLRFGGDRIS